MIMQPTFFALRTFALALGFFLFAATTARAQVDCPDECYCTNECDTAADCQDGMVCRAHLETDCPDDFNAACISGESDDECVARVEEQKAAQCQEIEVKRCDFYWSGTCDDDADCGDERLECFSGQGCEPNVDRCESDADCAAMWSCRDVEGFCSEDTEEHGECIDGRFSYRACSPAPYCGFADSAQPGSAASEDDMSDVQQQGEDVNDSASGDEADEADEESPADDTKDEAAVGDATNDASGCSVTTRKPASGTWSWALGALALVLFGRRGPRRGS